MSKTCECGDNCNKIPVAIYSHPKWNTKLVLVRREDQNTDQEATSYLPRVRDAKLLTRQDAELFDCDFDGLDPF